MSFIHMKEEILSFVTIWLDLKDIMPSKIIWTEKDKYCVFIYMWNLKKLNFGNKH